MSSLAETSATCSRAFPKIISRAVLMTCLVLVGHVSSAAAADSLAAALRESKALLDLRWRIEEVEQSDLRDSAEAVTLRGRFGFETGKFSRTSLLAEGEVVWAIDDRYNSTLNGRADLPVIADPGTHDLNRLQLTNTSLPGTTVVLGRQRIVLDDHRFVGDVGWRQNDQTFDAARITNHSIEKLTLDVTYLNQINRVFGKDSSVGRYTGDNYLINAAYKTKWSTFVGFSYVLDLKQAPTDSSRTSGLRFAGEWAWRAVRIEYSGSWATQTDRGRNPLRYSNDYYAAELTGSTGRYSVGTGIEVLDGNGVKGFSTPLATLHKFQGWADKFLTTPPNGIADRYVQLAIGAPPSVFDSLTASAIRHDFSAERGGMEYGSETDLQLQAKWHRLSGTLKYADYRARHFSVDTRKYWAQLELVL